ncbi:hypothetical protein OHT20_35245 [Streptomyces caniferus]|uniref:Uncharacterized protein n=1 Tax=Streptomyces caniferus TaxID=285557 RepID=A0A640S9T5_9ACTN|nr:hypothetical protein [Streptomyces caniferus]GFE08019.1 hypothetical protein Scani_42870 [Streptomyces caniferus]
MDDRHSSPHERVLAYLREGDQLIPPTWGREDEGEALYRALSDLANSAGTDDPETDGTYDPSYDSPIAWYESGQGTDRDRPAVYR